jgi:hypothetical protein
MMSPRGGALEFLSLNRQTLAEFPAYLVFIFVTVALSLPPPGNAQMLMNLSPQALPNSTAGPTYTGTLDAVKQRLNTPSPAPIQSKGPQAQTRDAAGRQPPNPAPAMPAGEVCELKMSQMNDIKQHKLVKVKVGPCLMVFNAND